MLPGDDDGHDDDGHCPMGTRCSPKTPYGLHFTLPSLFGGDNGAGPPERPAVAVGGTMEVELALRTSSGQRPLDLPYRAIADGPIAVETTVGPVVTVAGVQSGETLLHIVDANDGALFSNWFVQSAAVAKVEVISERETVPARPVAFVLGEHRIGVQLLDDKAHRLVDSSMKLALDGAAQTAWDTLTASVVIPGVRTLTASLGTEVARTFEVPFVDHADFLELPYEAPVTYGSRDHTDLMCFHPVSDGHHVVTTAADWSFSADAGVLRDLSNYAPGCVEITPRQLGMLHLTANALGASKTLTIVVNF